MLIAPPVVRITSYNVCYTKLLRAVIAAEVILGYLTFTGSLMAAGKLQEVLPTRPITYPRQNVINLSLLGIALIASVALVLDPTP